MFLNIGRNNLIHIGDRLLQKFGQLFCRHLAKFRGILFQASHDSLINLNFGVEGNNNVLAFLCKFLRPTFHIKHNLKQRHFQGTFKMRYQIMSAFPDSRGVQEYVENLMDQIEIWERLEIFPLFKLF